MSVSDETTVIFGFLGLLGTVVVVLELQRRRKEAQLAALAEIEIPILHRLKAGLLIAGVTLAGLLPVIVFLARLSDQTQHAAAAVVGGLGLALVGMFVGMKLAPRYARIGLLRCTPSRLELLLGAAQSHIDLSQPYQLDEAVVFTGRDHLQVLVVTQDGGELAFSYTLGMGRTSYGGRRVGRYIEPIIDGEARVIHDRIRRASGPGQ